MPPIRSDFPDHGPNPDFFVETGPERVRIVFQKSEFILKQLLLRRTAHPLLLRRHNCRPAGLLAQLSSAVKVDLELEKSINMNLFNKGWVKKQGLRQDSEAATINELTDQSKRIPC